MFAGATISIVPILIVYCCFSRFFMGGLEPTTDWPARLMEKFRKDFGDSL